MSNIEIFATNATADGDYPSTAIDWKGGTYTIDVDGTYDGATVTIKATQPTGTLKALSGAVFDVSNTAAGNITLGRGMKVQATISGAGASTDLTIKAFANPI